MPVTVTFGSNVHVANGFTVALDVEVLSTAMLRIVVLGRLSGSTQQWFRTPRSNEQRSDLTHNFVLPGVLAFPWKGRSYVCSHSCVI